MFEKLKQKRKKGAKHFDGGSRVTGFHKQSDTGSSAIKKKKNIIKAHSLKNFWSKIKVFILIGIISVVGGFIIYQGVRTVLKVRAKSQASLITSHAGTVIGFDEVAVFADSEYGVAEFVFKNNLHHDSVQQLLGKGFSIYRLPSKTPLDNVYTYYKEKMPALGWAYVADVPLESEEMLYGQYWVKNGIGVRIYSKIDDIWYQKLSEDDARAGLANEVQWKNERDAILAQADNYDLLPDFPWKLKLPSTYSVSYRLLTTYDLNGFDKLDKKENKAELEADQKAAVFNINTTYDYVILEPFAVYQGGFVNDYLDIYAHMKGLQILGSHSVSTNAGDSIEANVQYVGYSKGVEDDSDDDDDGDSDDDDINEESDNETSDDSSNDSGETKDDTYANASVEGEEPQYARVLLMLHDSRKVVYSLTLVGDGAEAEELYDYIKANIEISVPETSKKSSSSGQTNQTNPDSQTNQ